MAAALTPVQHVLTICQANGNEINAFEVTERLNTLEDYAELTHSDVKAIASKLEKRTVANGRVLLPQKLIKNVEAFCFWCREETRRGVTLDHTNFTTAILARAKIDMRRREEDKIDTPQIKPDKFKPKNWKTWAKQFDLYLSNHKGAQFCPLDYIIRPEVTAAHTHANPREAALYQYPLTGPHFREDNMQVFRMLSDLVSGTEGESWINQFNRAQHGRNAWLAFRTHYEGGGNERKKITEAESVIDMLHYKNESIFSFESYSTKMIEAFRDLDNTDSEKSPYEQVKIMLEKISINSAECEIHKAHVRSNFRNDITGAVTYLSTEFARMFPQATFSTGRRFGRQISAYQRNATRQRVGEYTMGLQPTLINGVPTINNVDVSNVGRSFTNDEMGMLGPSGQRYVFTERDRLGLTISRGDRGRGQGSFRGRGRGRGRGQYSPIHNQYPPQPQIHGTYNSNPNIGQVQGTYNYTPTIGHSATFPHEISSTMVFPNAPHIPLPPPPPSRSSAPIPPATIAATAQSDSTPPLLLTNGSTPGPSNANRDNNNNGSTFGANAYRS